MRTDLGELPMMNQRKLSLGLFGLSVVLCTSLAGCPMQDARFEPLTETPSVEVCISDADCDDGNACTMNSCDVATFLCVTKALDGVATPMASQSECFEHVCKMGVDTEIPITAGTPVTNQVTGDCKIVVCDGTGGEIEIDDDSDVQNDNLECTVDSCIGGAPSHENAPKDASCGANLACDGNGQCVGCTSDSDCAGGATDCTASVCNAGMCQLQVLEGKPLDTQTAGDCKARVCDGAGNPVDVADLNDWMSDGNECTIDECNGTTPVHSPVAAGTACSGNRVCDGAGNCLKAIAATCATNADCASGFCADGVCCDGACTTNCMACNVAGSEGTCTNVPLYQQDGTCMDTTVCNGTGACKIANGETCNGGDASCASGECKWTVCKGLKGHPCDANKDCLSNDCSNGFCD